MKRVIEILAIASVIGGLAMVTGCDKETWSRKGSSEVKFGATAHSAAVTRTDYQQYTGGDYQQLIWLSGDKIRIYSPDAARRDEVDGNETSSSYYYWADYTVTPASDPWNGTLSNVGGNGLVWLDENSAATFYAIYPSPGSDAGVGSNVAGVNGELPNIVIPSTQDYSVKGNMAYAYMTATKTVAQKGKVTLEFFPDFTAFEISLKCADADAGVKLKSFTIGSTGSTGDGVPNLAGQFYVKFASGSKSYRFINNTYASQTVTVNMASGGVSVPAGENDPLVFSVFALPQDLSPLYIQFETTSNSGDKTWKLDLKKSGSAINFEACKKHRIYGLELPNNEWLITYSSDDGMTVEEWVVDSQNDQTLVL